MKVVSLVFEYDLEKQRTSGRLWGKEGYRNKDYIFDILHIKNDKKKINSVSTNAYFYDDNASSWY